MAHFAHLTASLDETLEFAAAIGRRLQGGEVLELISDLGGGKTSFVSGLAVGFGSADPVASPTFTINYVYSRPDGKQLYHFDFYRLEQAGVVASELAEAAGDPEAVTVVEWGGIVHDVLPAERIIIRITVSDETSRQFDIEYPLTRRYLFDKLT